MALGSGGIWPCVSLFGANQFDVEDPKEKLQLAHFGDLGLWLLPWELQTLPSSWVLPFTAINSLVVVL